MNGEQMKSNYGTKCFGNMEDWGSSLEGKFHRGS